MGVTSISIGHRPLQTGAGMAWKVPGSNDNGSGAPDNGSGNGGPNPWPWPPQRKRRGGNGNPLDALRHSYQPAIYRGWKFEKSARPPCLWEYVGLSLEQNAHHAARGPKALEIPALRRGVVLDSIGGYTCVDAPCDAKRDRVWIHWMFINLDEYKSKFDRVQSSARCNIMGADVEHDSRNWLGEYFRNILKFILSIAILRIHIKGRVYTHFAL